MESKLQLADREDTLKRELLSALIALGNSTKFHCHAALEVRWKQSLGRHVSTGAPKPKP
jgi:hypothetical protein